MRQMAQRRGGAHWLDGLGLDGAGALATPAAALRLLHPTLRPGDESAPRRHPRGAGHLHSRHHRGRGEPAHRDRRCTRTRSCSRRRSSASTSWRRSATSKSPTNSAAFPPRSSTDSFEPTAPTPPGSVSPRRSKRSATSSSTAVREGANIVILSDRNSTATLRRDPEPPVGVGRPPPTGRRTPAHQRRA